MFGQGGLGNLNLSPVAQGWVPLKEEPTFAAMFGQGRRKNPSGQEKRSQVQQQKITKNNTQIDKDFTLPRQANDNWHIEIIEVKGKKHEPKIVNSAMGFVASQVRESTSHNTSFSQAQIFHANIWKKVPDWQIHSEKWG